MIITEEIEIRANSKHLNYYRNLGYNPILIGKGKGELFKIKIDHLSKHSHSNILCSCDVCGKEKYIKFLNYNKYIENDGIYTCEKCNYEKRKLTCLKTYGTENVSQNENIKKKKIETMKNNGKKLFWCRKEEHKKRIKELYGVDFVSQNAEIKNKIKKTNINKYGVEFVSQNEDIHLKQHKGYIIENYNGLYYRGTYEKDFIDFCIIKNLKIENFNKTIDYEINGIKRKYFPDFYYKQNNLIIEVKSSWTYEIEKEINEAKKDASISKGFNFIFIIDKNYKNFENYLISIKTC
jgi:hypothetical protein